MSNNLSKYAEKISGDRPKANSDFNPEDSITNHF